MDSSSSSRSVMMAPYLHFVTGDCLYFKTWQPTSAGAIAGACIGLILLALFDRWLAATRGILDVHWRQRAFALANSNSQYASSADNLDINSLDKSPVVQSDVQDALKQNIPTQKPKTAKARYSRTITPFIAAHDIPRGILYSLQIFMMYLLMMAVMTFQAAFLISIVLGLGIGEILFGRLAARML